MFLELRLKCPDSSICHNTVEDAATFFGIPSSIEMNEPSQCINHHLLTGGYRMKRQIRQWTLLGIMLVASTLLPTQLIHSEELENARIPDNTITHKALLTHPKAKFVSDSTKPPVRVLTLGSSVAHGWKDNPLEGGYLHRSFNALSEVTPSRYDVIDKAVPGKGVMTILDKYPNWLETYQPNVVVISWGGLDDLYAKTPMSTFDTQIRWQISLALQHHADVFVITPPISKASYTNYRVAQQNLMDNEMDVAESFNSPNVFVFNVFDEMKEYLKVHHQTYVPYMGDGWHPNAAGHALAAQILLQDMMQQFAVSQPTFRT